MKGYMKKFLIFLFFILMLLFLAATFYIYTVKTSFEATDIDDITIHGESINFNIGGTTVNEIEFEPVKSKEESTFITTAEELDQGVRPSMLSSGDYYLKQGELYLNYDQEISLTTPIKDGVAYDVVIKPVKGRSVLSITEGNQSTCEILIDPGHGGIDVGSIAIDEQTYEANLNLSVSEYLQEDLENLGYTTCMTRTTNDEDIVDYGEGSRTAMSYEYEAPYVVSIHHNTGLSTGYMILSSYFTTNDFSISVANQLNKFLVPSYIESDYLVDAEHAIIKAPLIEDDLLTDYLFIIREVGGRSIPPYQPEKNPYSDSAYGSESILVEVGFIDNYQDLEFLSNPSNQAREAELISVGIDEYIQNN